LFAGQRVSLIIPALDEEMTIASVVAEVDRTVVDRVIVADNGSTDQTAARARHAGAELVTEPRRGYGSACLAAIRSTPEAGILAFADGDGSDDLTQLPDLLGDLMRVGADLVIGSRVTGRAEPGALTPIQRFGNSLTCTLVRWLWGVRYTDLGPFRAITRSAYERLRMADPDFGWTIEMQVKAAQQGLKVIERPVRTRVRMAGHSKVSGTLLGSVRAGKRILAYVAEAKLKELLDRGR